MLHGRLGWGTSSATPAIRSGRHRRYGPWTCAHATSGDGQLVVLSRPGTASPAGFQHIPETKSGQNRLRLGQVGDDLDAATADAETLGGRWPEPGQIPRARRFQWRLMADPDGNEFGGTCCRYQEERHARNQWTSRR